MRLIVVILCLLMTSCALSDYPGVPVQAAQVRASLENRHDLVVPTFDEVYQTTTESAVWQAGRTAWRSGRGEIQDCDDYALDCIAELRHAAYRRGDVSSPAAFLLPVKLTDGRRHGVVAALCETETGAQWTYFDPQAMRTLNRNQIAHALQPPTRLRQR